MQEEFLAAIKDGNGARVRELLAADPSLADARDENGVSTLMLSRYHGAHEATAAIREARAELDVFEAATLGDVDTLHDLLREDPSLLDARSPDDATALHFAAFFAQPKTASLLVEHGADVHAVSTTFGNVTPLHSAAAGGSAEIVQLAACCRRRRERSSERRLHRAACRRAERRRGDGTRPARPRRRGRPADRGRSYRARDREEQGHDEVAALLRERA